MGFAKGTLGPLARRDIGPGATVSLKFRSSPNTGRPLMLKYLVSPAGSVRPYSNSRNAKRFLSVSRSLRQFSGTTLAPAT